MAPFIHESSSTINFHTDDVNFVSISSSQQEYNARCAGRKSSSSSSLLTAHASSSNGGTKTKKNVRFSKYAMQFTIPSLDEYTCQDLQSTYLTASDYERIRGENEIAVTRYYAAASASAVTMTSSNNNIGDHDEADLCIRGLETRFLEIGIGRGGRRRMIQLCVYSVLQEQDRARMSSSNNMSSKVGTMGATTPELDPRWIQHTYSRLTSPSTTAAYHAGLWDAFNNGR